MAIRCSFCARSADDGSVVPGPRGVAVCGACAELAVQVVAEAQEPDVTDRVITGIGTLVTQDERLGLDRWGVIREAGIVIRLGRVTWVGRAAEIPHRYRELPTLDAGGRAVIPGFVDPRTCLMGDAVVDVGDAERRVDTAVDMAGRMLQHGVTALGLRVGGTGDPTAETLALAAARSVGERLPSIVTIGWIDSGAMPVSTLARVMIPTAARLASTVEYSCSGEPHGPADDGRIETYAPLRPNVRLCDEPANCLDVAAGALTVEGWSQCDPIDAAVSVVEPLDLMDGRPLPIRKLYEAGGAVAIASSSSPDGWAVASPVLPMALAVDVGGLGPWETLWAATRGAAMALGDPERGRLRPGDPADLVILDAEEPPEILRRPDANPAWRVICGGAIVPM